MNFLALKPAGAGAAELPDGSRIALAGDAAGAATLGVRADALKPVDGRRRRSRGEVTVVERLGDAEFVYFRTPWEQELVARFDPGARIRVGEPHRLRLRPAAPISSTPTAGAAGAAAAATAAARSRPDPESGDPMMRPNIIFIMCDDHAARAISAYGGGHQPHPEHRPAGGRRDAPRRHLRDQFDLHAVSRAAILDRHP